MEQIKRLELVTDNSDRISIEIHLSSQEVFIEILKIQSDPKPVLVDLNKKELRFIIESLQDVYNCLDQEDFNDLSNETPKQVNIFDEVIRLRRIIDEKQSYISNLELKCKQLDKISEIRNALFGNEKEKEEVKKGLDI